MKLFNPKVSFVVPVFNVKSYLEKCLESIIRTNVEKEIILVDDGSTDGSREILKAYQEKYPYITLVLQSNKGVSAARNIGIKLAKAEYIQFVDSDDFLLIDNYDLLIKQAKATNADILRAQYLWVMPDGSKLSIYPPALLDVSEIPEGAIFAQSDGMFYLKKLYNKNIFPGVFLGFFCTETLRKYDSLFIENLSALEDQIFLWTFLSKDNIRVLEFLKPIYGYRFNPEGLSNKTNSVDFVLDIFKACDILWNEFYKVEDSELSSIIYGTIMRGYNIIYEGHYLKFTEENKAKVKHFFSPDIIASLEKFFNKKIEL